MEIKQVPNIKPEAADMVTVKMAGNVTEIRFSKTSAGSPIKKVDKDHGVDVRTGELVEFQHNVNRAGDKHSVAQSLKRLRDIINANLENPDNALWVTFTYAENMRDENDYIPISTHFGSDFSGIKKGKDKPPRSISPVPNPKGGVHFTFTSCFFFPTRPHLSRMQTWRGFGNMVLQR